MATAAQLVARRLYEAGCRHAFGIPGGEVLTVMEALPAVDALGDTSMTDGSELAITTSTPP